MKGDKGLIGKITETVARAFQDCSGRPPADEIKQKVSSHYERFSDRVSMLKRDILFEIWTLSVYESFVRIDDLNIPYADISFRGVKLKDFPIEKLLEILRLIKTDNLDAIIRLVDDPDKTELVLNLKGRIGRLNSEWFGLYVAGEEGITFKLSHLFSEYDRHEVVRLTELQKKKSRR